MSLTEIGIAVVVVGVVGLVGYLVKGKKGGAAGMLVALGGIAAFFARGWHNGTGSLTVDLRELREAEEAARIDRATERARQEDEVVREAAREAVRDQEALRKLPPGNEATDRDIEALIRAARRARRGERIEDSDTLGV